MIRQTLQAAAVTMLLSGTALATDGVPGWPGLDHPGFGSWSSQHFGPYTVKQGSVLAGMNEGPRAAHFTTTSNPREVYYLTCHTSAYNDTYGGRAHIVAVTWYPASWGNMPGGTPAADGLGFPRPSAEKGSWPNGKTGGTTVANMSGFVDEDTPIDELPHSPLMADGLIFGVGRGVPESEGGVLPNTRYNIDFIVASVFHGSMHGLGSACTVFPVYAP